MSEQWELLKALDWWGTQPFRRSCWDDPDARAAHMVPPVNVYEDKETMYVEAQLPGIDMDDVKISVLDRTLNLRGEQKGEREEKQENYHVREAHYGSFARSFRLPDYVDPAEAKATYDKGVLTVKVPKLEKAKPRLIPVEAGT